MHVFAQWKEQGEKWVEYVKICHGCVFSPAFEHLGNCNRVKGQNKVD